MDCNCWLEKISEAFKKSIEEVRESIQERNDFYFVESKALQLILNQTNELCIKYGIEFCADIRYGNFLFMTFPDVFSLFENALCNAVNACLQLGEEEKKRIEHTHYIHIMNMDMEYKTLKE